MKRDSNRERLGRRLRDRLRETTCNAILDATESVLAESGFRGARMETIARRSGVALGTLYHHFADRDSLLRTLFEVRSTELLETAERALEAGRSMTFPEHLVAFLRDVLGFVADHHVFFSSILQGELVTDELGSRDAVRAFHGAVDRLIHRGVSDRVLRGDEAAAFPAMLIGLVRGVAVTALVRDGTPPLVEHAGAMARLFLHGALDRSALG